MSDNIIHTAAECNVKQFMQCRYEQKYKVLLIEGTATDEELKAAFEYIYAQYVDLTGLYQTKEFEKYAYINSLHTRKVVIEEFVRLQKETLKHFDVPFLPAFSFIKGRYGISLYWDINHPDKEVFISKLDQVLLRESKYDDLLKKAQLDLIDMQKKHEKKQYDPLQSRKEFISMMNRLQQNKFVIDKKETSVEELALMVNDSREQQMEAQAAKQYKKR